MAQSDVTTKILEIQVEYADALNKIAQYRVEIDKIKEKQKELKTQLKENKITQEEYHKAMESSKQLTSQYNNAVSVLTKQISNQLKVEKEQEGSLVQLRAKLSNLTAEYDRLSKAEREGAKGTALKDKINAVTSELKGLEEATQRYYRNVGNYPQTLASLGTQLDECVDKLRSMKNANQENTPEFDAMAEKAEHLREVLATASNEGGLSMQNLANDITSLGFGFNEWVDIFEKAGFKSEECQKTLSQMMIVITALSTAVKIYNAFQKESALYTTALQLKTMLLNTSLGQYLVARAAATTATAAGTTATGAASAATAIFNAVLYANPLVWLIGIIAAAVAAIYGLVKASQFFTSSSEEQKKALTEEAKQLEELQNQLEQSRAMMEAYGKTKEEIARQTITDNATMYNNYVKHFNKIKELYDEDDDEYKEALDAKKKADEAYKASLQDGLILLTKIQAEQHEAERKEALGEYEYKRTLIKEQTQQQILLAKELLRHNKITKAEYDALVKDLNNLQKRNLDEINKEETKANQEKEKQRADAAKQAADKRREQEKKLQEDLLAEVQKGQDAMIAVIQDSYQRQTQAENLAYERSLKQLQDKLSKYKSSSAYDVKMRTAINQQIQALTTQHERTLTSLEQSEMERRIKVSSELLQSKLSVVKKGTQEEETLRYNSLSVQHQQEIDAINKRVSDGLLTEEQGNELKLNLEEQYRRRMAEIADEYDKLELERQKATLQTEIDNMQLAEDERQMRLKNGHEMSDQEYESWRQKGIESLDEHERAILLKQEEAAQQELEALQARGQLSTQTTEEYEAEILAAKQRSAQAQANTNQAIIKNEQAKAQAMKAVTSSLTGLLDTLGESNAAFAKMSKIITLAQIAIDTGKALSAGIASASAVPFPGNLVAIATTVATVLANIATAISTVKSAKFAQGGKVNGPGTGTSDSIPAMLSNGEFVMTAQATRMFEPVLTAMNNIGRGVPMQVSSSYKEVETAETLTNSFETAAKEIRPVVSVVEITEAAERVEMIESLDNF